MTHKTTTPIRDFEPPYDRGDLPMLDHLHDRIGMGKEWRASEQRAALEGKEPLYDGYSTIIYKLQSFDAWGSVDEELRVFYVCGNCAALVEHPPAHTKWHEEMVKFITESIQQMGKGI